MPPGKWFYTSCWETVSRETVSIEKLWINLNIVSAFKNSMSRMYESIGLNSELYNFVLYVFNCHKYI